MLLAQEYGGTKTLDKKYMDMYNSQLSNSGRKDDRNKPPFHLLPWDALEEVTRAYALGRDKYGARNWESGLEYSRLYRALIGHAVAWFQKGEEYDEEGNSHLNAMVFNALALRTLTLRNRADLDDRPKVPKLSPYAPVAKAG